MTTVPRNYKHLIIQEKLPGVPEKTGVYLLKDKNNRILYVGKAKNLEAVSGVISRSLHCLIAEKLQ